MLREAIAARFGLRCEPRFVTGGTANFVGVLLNV